MLQSCADGMVPKNMVHEQLDQCQVFVPTVGLTKQFICVGKKQLDCFTHFSQFAELPH
jgi:hypothetical protein